MIESIHSAQRVLQAKARRVSQRAISILSGEAPQQLVMLLRKVHGGLANPN